MYVKQIEQSWVVEFRRGDEQALRQAFDLFYQPVCHFAQKLVCNVQAAEDIVSEVFLKIWGLRESFDREDAIRSFLFVAVRNACFNYRVKMRRELTHRAAWQYLLTLSDEQADHEMALAMTLQRIYAAIEQLPPQRKAICKLIFIKEVSAAGAARQLGISVQTVRNQKIRAIQQLRSLLIHDLYKLHFKEPAKPAALVRIPHI